MTRLALPLAHLVRVILPPGTGPHCSQVGPSGAGKRYKPEEIVGKLIQGEVLNDQGMAMAIRLLGTSEVTLYRWRKEDGGMSDGQPIRLNQLKTKNERLRRAVPDLTLDKRTLAEAAWGSFLPVPAEPVHRAGPPPKRDFGEASLSGRRGSAARLGAMSQAAVERGLPGGEITDLACR